MSATPMGEIDMRSNSGGGKGNNNNLDPTLRDHEGKSGPAQTSATAGQEPRDPTGNARRRGEDPSPDDRARGETASSDKLFSTEKRGRDDEPSSALGGGTATRTGPAESKS